MLYLPVDCLKPGMVLARSIPSSNPILPLLVTGQPLNEETIRIVLQRGIKGLYIENELTDDIVCEEFLSSEEKQAMLADIKSEMVKLTKNSKRVSYRTFTKIAESIVMSALDQDNLLCNMNDIRDYDNYTYSHSLYVGIISVILGKAIGLNQDQLHDVAMAGLMHDIGKLDIPAKIINKPGSLTEEEFALIKQHPMQAVDRLRGLFNCRETIVQGVACHHEYYNGTGYPREIEGNSIPLYGRILAIADVYDALSAKRSYREPWTSGQIIDYIVSRSGIQFDPELLVKFLSTVSAYPTGCLVKLSDNSVGIVVQNHPGFSLRPTVRLLSPPELLNTQIDLSKEYLSITVVETIGSNDKFNLPGMK